MSDFKRSDRVAGAIRAALAEVLLEGMRDPRLQSVSVTEVELSPDLGVAIVRVLPLGGLGDRDALMAGLERARGYLRTQVGRRVRLRHVPELRFELDEQFEESVRMVELLSAMEASREPEPGEE